MRLDRATAGAVTFTAGVIPLVRYRALLPVHGLGLALALPAAAIGVLLAFTRPRLLLVLLVPAATVCRGYGLFGPDIVVALALLLLFGTLLRILQGRRTAGPAQAIALLLAGLVVAGHLLPGTSTPVLGDSGHVLRYILAGIGLLAVAAADPPDPRRLVPAIACGSAVLGVVSLLTGTDPEGRLLLGDVNPNFLGAGLVPGLVGAVGLARHRRNPLWLLPAVACAVPLVATESRGAALAAAVGVAAVLVTDRSPGGQALIVGTAGAVVLGFPALARAVPALVLSDRSSASMQANSDIRAAVARLALGLIRDHPLRGIGFGHFPYYSASSPQVGFLLSTHDDYLELATELGLPALALLLLLLWLALRPARTGERAVLRCVVAAQAVDMLFANTLDKPAVIFAFWISLGVLVSAEARARVPAPRPASGAARPALAAATGPAVR
jgi:hypothetical protein